METVTDFIFLVSRITVDGDCSHEIKRPLLFGRKTMTNLDSILKSRDITLPTKVHIVQAMVFPVVVYGCESWTIKNWCIQTVVTVSDFIFGGSKTTADGDCSHEIKRHLLLGRKAMTNLSSVQFSRSVVSDSLRPHESQHARPPCPSPTPGVH